MSLVEEIARREQEKKELEAALERAEQRALQLAQDETRQGEAAGAFAKRDEIAADLEVACTELKGLYDERAVELEIDMKGEAQRAANAMRGQQELGKEPPETVTQPDLTGQTTMKLIETPPMADQWVSASPTLEAAILQTVVGIVAVGHVLHEKAAPIIETVQQHVDAVGRFVGEGTEVVREALGERIDVTRELVADRLGAAREAVGEFVETGRELISDARESLSDGVHGVAEAYVNEVQEGKVIQARIGEVEKLPEKVDEVIGVVEAERGEEQSAARRALEENLNQLEKKFDERHPNGDPAQREELHKKFDELRARLEAKEAAERFREEWERGR